MHENVASGRASYRNAIKLSCYSRSQLPAPIREQTVPFRSRQDGKAAAAALLVSAVIAGLIYLAKHPEEIRIRPLQVRVGVSVRGSAVGIGNVLQIRNTSERVLYGVEVTARKDAANPSADYTLGI